MQSEINVVLHFERGKVKRFVSYAEVERLREYVLTNANKPTEILRAEQENAKRAADFKSGTTSAADRHDK